MEASPTTFGLSTIGQIAVTVTDISRSVKYYREVLGLPMLFEAPGMAFFRAGDVRLMLAIPESAGDARYSSIVYFRVDDIQVACQELADRGVSFTHEPRLVHRGRETDLWLAFFKDPDGNALALMNEIPRRG